MLRRIDIQGLVMWLALSLIALVILLNTQTLEWTPSLILAASVGSFLVMFVDKRQAILKGDRLSERSLQLMALLGGSPGVVAGMYTFRHKTKKLGFKVVIFMIAGLQLYLALTLVPGLSI